MKLGNGDPDGQAESGQYAASAERNRDAHNATLPNRLRCEIGEDAAGQIDQTDDRLRDGSTEKVIEKIGGLAEFRQNKSRKTDEAAADDPADALLFERGHFAATLEKDQESGGVDYVAGQKTGLSDAFGVEAEDIGKGEEIENCDRCAQNRSSPLQQSQARRDAIIGETQRENK